MYITAKYSAVEASP